MILDNLVGISLEKIEPDEKAIKRLLGAAERNIADSHVEVVSCENCFDAAYKAIMQLANPSLQPSAYRMLSIKPGHHRTLLQSLVKTIDLDHDTIVVLDALRKQRNVADYFSESVSESTMEECIKQAEDILVWVKTWLENRRA